MPAHLPIASSPTVLYAFRNDGSRWMDQVTVRVDASGRVVIPRDMRDALGIPDGGELRLSVQDGELRATTRLAALRRIRAELKALPKAPPPAAPLLSEALIAGRRAEAVQGLHEEQASPPVPPHG